MNIAVPETHSTKTLGAPVLLSRACMVVGLLLVVLKIVPALVSLVMLGLAVYAWKGPKEGLQALTLLFLVLNLNQGLYPFWGLGASLRWLVLFSALGRLIWDSVLSGKKWPVTFNAMLLLYASVIVCLSLLASRSPAISVFKAIAFCTGAITVVTCFYRTRTLQSYWFSWFFSFFAVLLIFSIPLYLSHYGFYTNGRGFQGILIHPQTYGPVMAPFTAGLTALLVLQASRSPLVICGVLGGVFSIVVSQSRTAMLMYAVSLLAMAGVSLFRGERFWMQNRRPLLPAGLKLMALLSFCLLLVVNGASLGQAVEKFVLKQAENQESMSFKVRASMVDEQLANFKEQPLTGIGFGIPSSTESWVSLSTGFLGIPTGFPVEKGFLPSATLEETGLIGAALLTFLFFGMLARVVKKGSLPLVAMMLACLLANAGEMVFFSFGAAGLYYWLLIGFCYNSVIPGATSCVE